MVLRKGPAEFHPGDMAPLPADVENAHPALNRGTAPLRYLCAGTNPNAETVRYPGDAQTLVRARPDFCIAGDDGTVMRAGTDP